MSNTIEFRRSVPGSRPALQSIAGTASRRGQVPLAPLAARHTPTGPITVGTLRTLIAAADALRRFLTDDANVVSFADLARPRGPLADLLHRYQAASRQCVREWLQDPSRLVWLVEAGSGRILDTTAEPLAPGGGLEESEQATLADAQPLHGLRTRHARPGIGIPLVVSYRDALGAPRGAPSMAVRTRTAIVGVERGFDARVRSVRVRLFDPEATDRVRLFASDLPLAADWTAAVAFQLGQKRRTTLAAAGDAPADPMNAFTPLMPVVPGRAPLVMLEGSGLSPLMMAHVANEIAGDPQLRSRYCAWLYSYPMTAPLVQSAGALRRDLERFCAKLEREGAGVRATVVAQGPSAVLARTLLTETGDALWNGVFTETPDAIALGAHDRRRLESLLMWTCSTRVERVIAVNLPDNLAALAAGVGERAVQAVQQQPKPRRAAFERLFGATRRWLRPASGPGARHAEPLHEAIYAAAVAADRTLLSLLAEVPAGGTVLYDPAVGSQPTDALTVADGTPLGPQALERLLSWLRRPSHREGT